MKNSRLRQCKIVIGLSKGKISFISEFQARDREWPRKSVHIIKRLCELCLSEMFT